MPSSPKCAFCLLCVLEWKVTSGFSFFLFSMASMLHACFCLHKASGGSQNPPFIVLRALPSFVILCTHVVLVLSSSIITCVDN